MKAVRIHKFGGEEVLEYEDAPDPQPGRDDVLVKVEAAGLNRADLGTRDGTGRYTEKDLPMIMGFEFAGTVAAVGSNVTDFQPGQRVVADPGRGGYAEYALAKHYQTRPVPDGLDAATAAAMPAVFLTAYHCMVSHAGLKADDRVLIQAGGSGVGVAAIQIAKHLGARVITTAGSDEKCRRLHDLGADETINYTRQDFVQEVNRLTGGRGVDLVLEMVGGAVFDKSLEVLAPGGRLVTIGRAGGPVPEPLPTIEGRSITRFGITAHLTQNLEGYKALDQFMALVRDKRMQVCIDRTYPLAKVAEAHRRLEGREHFGKVVLTP
ncbi:MAG: NAD(P)H-quinone oxidoreductase [Dehalococcoidia bacterium]|nr:NAD(P)H-quinone oxidoreductase [Dehalococcoidia bacterium]